MSLLSVNVATLAKKLQDLLSAGFPLLVCSEIRVPLPSLRSVSRRAFSLGFSSVFSCAPPPSPTFATSPGGVCVFASSEYPCRELRPPILEQWRQKSRIVTAVVTCGAHAITIIGIYGYPKSHPDVGCNEALFMHVFTWMSQLRNPAIAVGDYNVCVGESQCLSLVSAMGLKRITGVSPTTKGRKTPFAKNTAIDHLVANMPACDLGLTARTMYDFSVSDHYPICASFSIAPSPFPVWVWPAKCELPKAVRHDVPWTASPNTLVAWSEACTKWLTQATDVTVPSKQVVHTVMYSHKAPVIHKTFMRILAAQRALEGIRKSEGHPTDQQVASLKRKLRVLGVDYNMGDPSDIDAELATLMNQHFAEVQEQALMSWKQRVKEWIPSSKELYRYLRNTWAPKPTVLLCDDHPVSEPLKVADALNSFWGGLESWQQPQLEQDARSKLEDAWAIFLPHVPFEIHLQGIHLKNQSLSQKVSAPGPDGWGASELALLPVHAWDSLLSILAVKDNDFSSSLLAIFRRIPVEKERELTSLPTPEQIRPLDIFSMVVRILASTQAALLRPWLAQVVHPTQYATFGGCVPPIARMTIASEQILQKRKHLLGVSVDFTKMFNHISPSLAADVAVYLGLRECDAKALIAPFASSRGAWCLGFNAVVPMRQRSRGLPQGLSTSVALAELVVSVYLWKVHKIALVEY